MLHTPIYDPQKTWEENFEKGPFGAFADGEKYIREKEPSFTVLGHKVHLPFGIAAGPLPTSRHIKAAFEKGFDVNVYKTQRSTFFPANQFPNILYLETEDDLTIERANTPLVGREIPPSELDRLTITNSFGNPSSGPDFWIGDLSKALSYQKKGQLLIMSVVGTIKDGYDEEAYFDDFANTAFIAGETGVKVIEVNLSCPNVASEGVLCYTPSAVYEITKRVKEKIGNTPLLAKLGYFLPEQEELFQKVIKKITPFVEGISVINTLAAPIVNEQGEQALPGENRLKSGVCGAGIRWAGFEMVERLYNVREKLNAEFEIIGVGGVLQASDYHEYVRRGADIVMSATGAIWNPYLAQEIEESLKKR